MEVFCTVYMFDCMACLLCKDSRHELWTPSLLCSLAAKGICVQMDTHLGSILDEVIVKVFILQDFIWIMPCIMYTALSIHCSVTEALHSTTVVQASFMPRC